MYVSFPTKGQILEHPKKVASGANVLIITHYDGKEKTLSYLCAKNG